MSTCVSLESYKGRGSLAMAERASDGTLGPWFNIAEARRLEFLIEQDFEDQYSRCDVNSGNIIHNINQSDYSVEIDAFDFSAGSLARAYYGASSTVSGTTVSAESKGVVSAGEQVVVDNPFNLTVVTVTDDGTPKVLGTDYTFDADHGVFTAVTNFTTDMQISYTFATYEEIQGVISGLKEYAFRFDGYNINNSNKPLQVYIWRVALNASSILSLISEETNVLTLSGKALADGTKGAGESKYFVVKKVV